MIILMNAPIDSNNNVLQMARFILVNYGQVLMILTITINFYHFFSAESYAKMQLT